MSLLEVLKGNPYRDSMGRFATKNSRAGTSGHGQALSDSLKLKEGSMYKVYRGHPGRNEFAYLEGAYKAGKAETVLSLRERVSVESGKPVSKLFVFE